MANKVGFKSLISASVLQLTMCLEASITVITIAVVFEIVTILPLVCRYRLYYNYLDYLNYLFQLWPMTCTTVQGLLYLCNLCFELELFDFSFQV